MEDKRQRVEELKRTLQEGLTKLENVNVDDLTDEDLESVAGGNEEVAADCSTWCCSEGTSEVIEAADA